MGVTDKGEGCCPIGSWRRRRRRRSGRGRHHRVRRAGGDPRSLVRETSRAGGKEGGGEEVGQQEKGK